MAEVERKTSREEILAAQIEAVANFGPEKILASEKREQMTEAVTNGLDLCASEIKLQAEETNVGWDKLPILVGIEMRDFTRAALTTPPLPPQAFEMDEPSFEAEVAEGHDWWQELSSGQKNALSQILKEDFGIDVEEERKPLEKPGYEGCKVIKSEKIITVPPTEEWPENKFQPALVFDFTGEPYCLTCYVVG